MSKRCKVAGYIFSVRRLHSRTGGEMLGKFDGSSDIGDVLLSLIRKNIPTHKVAMTGKAISFKPDSQDIRRLSGQIFSGDFGFESDIFDTSKNTVSYKKKKSDADLHPLYFYIASHPRERFGIICFQQSGTAGVKQIFENTISAQFSVNYPDFRLHINSLTISDALEHYIRGGEIEELILEKHEIPADIADKVAGHKKIYPGVFTYSIKPSSSKFFKKSGLIAYVRNKPGSGSSFNLNKNEFDVVKTRIRVGETTKTYDLSSPDVASMSVDVTDSVQFGPNGHPTPNSLFSEFEKVAKDLAARGNIKL